MGLGSRRTLEVMDASRPQPPKSLKERLQLQRSECLAIGLVGAMLLVLLLALEGQSMRLDARLSSMQADAQLVRELTNELRDHPEGLWEERLNLVGQRHIEVKEMEDGRHAYTCEIRRPATLARNEDFLRDGQQCRFFDPFGRIAFGFGLRARFDGEQRTALHFSMFHATLRKKDIVDIVMSTGRSSFKGALTSDPESTAFKCFFPGFVWPTDDKSPLVITTRLRSDWQTTVIA